MPEDTFDYDSAMGRVSIELGNLADELWPSVEKERAKYYDNPKTKEEKIEAVGSELYKLLPASSARKFSMLRELKHECYWHADDYLPEIKDELGESLDFYMTLMIEQAKKRHNTEKRGYAWIVNNYDSETVPEFKRVITPEMLAEFVNIAFWEIANKYLVQETQTSVPWKEYGAVMKHAELIDLTRVDEFAEKKRPLNSKTGWVNDEYVSAFERARKKLSVDSSVWLARPLIEMQLLQFNCTESSQQIKKLLTTRLANYQEYLNTKLIQDLFKSELSKHASYFDSDRSFFRIGFIDALKEYYNVSDEEFRNLISSSLDIKDPIFEKTVVQNDLPKSWLNASTLEAIKNRIIKYIDSRDHSGEWNKGAKSDIIPNLSFLQDSFRGQWISEEDIKGRISNYLKEYLSQKRRPGGEPVQTMLSTLDPNLTDQTTYREVVHRGISDLVIRKRIKEATKWYERAKGEGWLDESKIPKFELYEQPIRTRAGIPLKTRPSPKTKVIRKEGYEEQPGQQKLM